ncbi:hypothetical protein BHE90_017307 [Fusarium euwallaceae]|uniref:Uncharacterized protein n=1 Tax=Fusarium euwallaceae TaxID=1147111 RepID=A0A430KXT8_9HYPO|nr:hypothetical protein BHE90_017307 [Fusarium euwallaceae]
MEGLTSPDAMTRCPKRVRLDSEYVGGLPPWANGYEGNGDDDGNSIGWGPQVFGLPAEPLTPAASPDSTFHRAESTNPSTLLPHQGECANHVKLSAPLLPLASSPRRLDHCSRSTAFIDGVKDQTMLYSRLPMQVFVVLFTSPSPTSTTTITAQTSFWNCQA